MDRLGGGEADCDRELFREVIGHFMTGVTVITTTEAGRDHGMSASAVSSLSLDPPMLLACLNDRSPTQQAISRSRRFCVNVLAEDQLELALRFARPADDKFAGVATHRGALDVPVLSDALATLQCRVDDDVVGGTHRVFLARVQHAQAREGTPLAYFRGGFGRVELAANARAHAAIDRTVAERAFDARTAIELGVVDLTVGRVTGEQLAALRRSMERTNGLIADGRFTDVAAYVAANAELHEQLVALAGNDALLEAYRRLSIPTLMIRLFTGHDRADESLIDEHRAIVEAYEAGDVERARAVVLTHGEHAKATNDAALAAAGGRI